MPRRHRFPLYAPESIERRLNPSPVAFPTSPVPADFAPIPAPEPILLAPEPAPVPSPYLAPEPGDPPIIDPNIPIGPALPA